MTNTNNNLNVLMNNLNGCLARYKIVSHIASGSFGMIFMGNDTETKHEVAVKVEKVKRSRSKLGTECVVLRMMQKTCGFPVVYDYGLACTYKYVVMELLGLSLTELLKLCGGKFSEKTVIMIAIQGIKRLKDLHDMGYVHRDIKPDNFLLGRQENVNVIYLIDFGLAKEYVDKSGIHISPRRTNALVGTLRYASVNAHMGNEQSRRDDLISFTYMLIYLFKGCLPWQGLQANNEKEKLRKIEEMKTKIPLEGLCSTLPRELRKVFSNIHCLGFADFPDYTFYIDTLQEYFPRTHQLCDFQFDWSSKLISSETDPKNC